MKKFKFNYSPVVWALIAIVIALSVASVVWNVYNVVFFIKVSTFKAVLYSLTVLISLFLAILALGICFYGCYTVDEKNLISHFGIIYSRIELKDVSGIVRFKKTNKLVIYLKGGKFSVILISPALYDDFISSLIKSNPEIAYSCEDGETEE